MRAIIGTLLVASTTAYATAPQPPHPATPACLRYEPDTVVITGVLSRQMFYGAPGFGEHPETDHQEVGFYLAPRTPLCTVGSKKDDTNDARQDIRSVQIVLDSSGYEKLRPMLGTTISLRGTAFASFDGHHHAPLLLSFISVVPTPKHP